MLIRTLLSTAYGQSTAFDLQSAFAFQGDARDRGNRIEMIEGALGQVGAAWVVDSFEVPAGGGFRATFEVEIDVSGYAESGGLAFVLQGQGTTPLGSGDGGLGYQGIAPSVAVELDTWLSYGVSDLDGNHVGINLDGSPTSVVASPVPFDLDTVARVHGRVDYVAGELRVSVGTSAPDGSAPLVSLALSSLSGPLWVGFTASSGEGSSARTLRAFSFRADGDSDGDGLLDFEDFDGGTTDTGTLPTNTDDTNTDDTNTDDTAEGDDDDDDDGGSGGGLDTGLEYPSVFFCGCANGGARAASAPIPVAPGLGLLLMLVLRRSRGSAFRSPG